MFQLIYIRSNKTILNRYLCHYLIFVGGLDSFPFVVTQKSSSSKLIFHLLIMIFRDSSLWTVATFMNSANSKTLKAWIFLQCFTNLKKIALMERLRVIDYFQVIKIYLSNKYSVLIKAKAMKFNTKVPVIKVKRQTQKFSIIIGFSR